MTSKTEPPKSGASDEVVEALREDGLDKLADFAERTRQFDDLSRSDFYAALVENYVIRLRNPDGEIQYSTTTDGDLMQIRDKDRTGEFGRPFGAWKDEVLDQLLSGRYEVTFLFPEDSAFEVVEA